MRTKTTSDYDKREVYKDEQVVATYDSRLYFGRSRGLFLRREIAAYHDFFPDHGRVLDCPCGTGKLALGLRDKPGLTLIGGDISPLMLERARQTGGYGELLVMDLTHAPFPDSHFDVVFISRFFMLFPKVDEFLVEIRRLLKPGGLLIFDSVRRSIHNRIHGTIGTNEGWNYPRQTRTWLEILARFGFQCEARNSAFLVSTGIMNRLPPFLFRALTTMERVLPERVRVYEAYKMRRV